MSSFVSLKPKDIILYIYIHFDTDKSRAYYCNKYQKSCRLSFRHWISPLKVAAPVKRVFKCLILLCFCTLTFISAFLLLKFRVYLNDSHTNLLSCCFPICFNLFKSNHSSVKPSASFHYLQLNTSLTFFKFILH